MNQVPLTVAQPVFDLGNSLGGGAAVGRNPVKIDFAGEQGPSRKGVSYRNRIPDDANVGQSRNFLNGGKGIHPDGFLLLLSFRCGKKQQLRAGC